MSEVELATRRQLRNSAQDEYEMPSLEQLGLSLPSETHTFHRMAVALLSWCKPLYRNMLSYMVFPLVLGTRICTYITCCIAIAPANLLAGSIDDALQIHMDLSSAVEMAAEEAELSESELQDLPKVAVRVLQNKRNEDLEVRRRLAAWKSRFESSFLSSAEEQPSEQRQTEDSAGPEEGPSAAQTNLGPGTVQSLAHAGKASDPAEGPSKPARRSSRAKPAARSQSNSAAADSSAACSLEQSGKRVAQAAGLADKEEGMPECHRLPPKRMRMALPASSPAVAEQATQAARTDTQPEAGQSAGNGTLHSAVTASGHSAGVGSAPQPSDQRAMHGTDAVEPQGPGVQAGQPQCAGNGVAQSEPAAFGGSAVPEHSTKRSESASRQAPAAGGRCSGAAVATHADALLNVDGLDIEVTNPDNLTAGSQIDVFAGSVTERLKQIAASQAEIASLLEDD